MWVMEMYTATCTRLVHTNSLILFGMVVLSLVVGVRLVPLGLTRLITLITIVTLPLIIFFLILGMGHTLMRKHLTFRGR